MAFLIFSFRLQGGLLCILLQLRQPEVEQLRPLFRHDDVARFDAPVRHASPMSLVQRGVRYIGRPEPLLGPQRPEPNTQPERDRPRAENILPAHNPKFNSRALHAPRDFPLALPAGRWGYSSGGPCRKASGFAVPVGGDRLEANGRILNCRWRSKRLFPD